MRKGDATRQAILDHAVRAASKVGLEGLSIGGLAKELELSKSGLFAHFQSKDQLKAEIIERAATIFSETVVGPALAKPRGLPRIREMFSRWMGWTERPACTDASSWRPRWSWTISPVPPARPSCATKRPGSKR